MISNYQQFDLFGKKTFVKARMTPPFKVPYIMAEEACFLYLVEGDSRLFAPTTKMDIVEQEGVVMQCGNYLLDILNRNQATYCEAIAIHLYPDVLKAVFKTELPDFLVEMEQIQPIIAQKEKASALLKNYISSLQFYFENPILISEELLKLKIKELLLLLAKTDNIKVIKKLIHGLFTPIEVDFKEVIDNNLYENIGLERLAIMTNLSLSSFKRTFAKHYNTSPAKYIRQQKVLKAAKLLKGTDLRISTIAYDCGFVDLAHFSRTFYNEFNLTPTEYRLA